MTVSETESLSGRVRIGISSWGSLPGFYPPRIKAAEKAGLIIRLPFAELGEEIRQNLGDGDKRFTYLIPTTLLERELRAHLSETLSEAMQKIPQK